MSIRRPLLGGAAALALLGGGYAAQAAPLAFPYAVGYGKNATGGRGGKVYPIRTTADSGPGSLRECVEATGPRICVIQVSGTIELMTALWPKGAAQGNFSIRGEASAGGVQLKLNSNPTRGITPIILSGVNNVVIRNIAIRPGYDRTNPKFERNSLDCITAENVADVTIDSTSCQFSADEGLNVHVAGKNITFSRSIVSHGIYNHNYGFYACSNSRRGQGCGSMTVYGNLFHNLRRRNPLIQNNAGVGAIDVINNVSTGCYEVCGELSDDTAPGGMWNGREVGSVANWVGNYASPHARANKAQVALLNNSNYNAWPNIFYLHDNVPDAGLKLLWGNWRDYLASADQPQPQPVAPLSVAPMPGGAVKAEVLAKVGHKPRDALNQKAVAEAGPAPVTVAFNTQSGPWPALTGALPPDSDLDGMDDGWERSNGLNVGVDDSAQPMGTAGYTAVEMYLESRAQQLGLNWGATDAGGGTPGGGTGGGGTPPGGGTGGTPGGGTGETPGGGTGGGETPGTGTGGDTGTGGGETPGGGTGGGTGGDTGPRPGGDTGPRPDGDTGTAGGTGGDTGPRPGGGR